MFLLPLPRSPGEHGTEDHAPGMIARARRSFRQNAHMGVNGFIACALLIQAFSTAGVMPAQVWVAEPGYALIVCLGMATLSACILFCLKSLLTQPSSQEAPAYQSSPAQAGSRPENLEVLSPQPRARLALVIHASRTTQTIIEKSLAKAGIQAVCVNAQAAAQQALQSNTFGVVIAEAALLENNGLLTPQGAIEYARSKGIPVLALLAEKVAGARGPAADAIVTVPIVPDDLARLAMDLIARPVLEPGAITPQIALGTRREMPKLEPDPLDARALGDLEKLGGRDFVRDIVAQFVADAAAVLAGLAAAVAARDTKNFREQAHALRSCAANVGAQNVYRMCLAWRDLDAQEIAASGAHCMQMLEEEFERVRGALTPMLQQDDGGSGPNTKAA
jgi:two-component system sensor histidine kinase RpfC